MTNLEQRNLDQKELSRNCNTMPDLDNALACPKAIFSICELDPIFFTCPGREIDSAPNVF